MACVVIFVWRFLPSFTLFVFLCLAAYHFGKEDTQLFLWTNYAKQSVTLYGKYTKSYYFFIFFKGFLVITAPLYFHYDKTINIFNILNSNFTLLHDLSFNFVGDSIVPVSSVAESVSATSTAMAGRTCSWRTAPTRTACSCSGTGFALTT